MDNYIGRCKERQSLSNNNSLINGFYSLLQVHNGSRQEKKILGLFYHEIDWVISLTGIGYFLK